MGSRYEETTVLVTGAQGFVGCWVAERLLGEGARVVVPFRDAHPERRFRLDGIEKRCVMVEGDVVDHDAMLAVLDEYRPQAIFHLAAQPIVGIANRAPLSTFESNIRGTYSLL